MIRRTALPLAAAALLAACDAPDLKPTHGGYAPGMAPAAADTGGVAPHGEPALPDVSYPTEGDPAGS